MTVFKTFTQYETVLENFIEKTGRPTRHAPLFNKNKIYNRVMDSKYFVTLKTYTQSLTEFVLPPGSAFMGSNTNHETIENIDNSSINKEEIVPLPHNDGMYLVNSLSSFSTQHINNQKT